MQVYLILCPTTTLTFCAIRASSGLIVYFGMMVGAFLWGAMADRIGRRQSLLISLSINSIFSFFSSFVQGYSTFLFCRLLSGVG